MGTKVHMIYMIDTTRQAKRREKTKKQTACPYLEFNQSTKHIMVIDIYIHSIKSNPFQKNYIKL